MLKNHAHPARLRWAGVTAAIAVIAGTAFAGTGAAVAAPSDTGATVASGSNWSITRAAGGYEVDLKLASALPVRDDVPELFADDIDLGPALESADHLTLSASTSDPAVAGAETVFWQWASGGSSTATGPTTALGKPAKSLVHTQALNAQTADVAPSDPTSGTGAYTVADYNFGSQSIPLANLGGKLGELEGRIYLPTAPGPHPLVIFLHGRHSTCYNITSLRATSAWPCAAGTTPILSYAGYDGAGEALAADGYTVVSASANSINAFDGSLGADAGAVARGQLILDTLTMLKHANDGDAVSYYDATAKADVTLDQALVAGQATSPAAETLTAAQLVNTMDFSDIGLMGHSRGGEGAVTAGVLNEGLAHPWAIKSIFALAPIDFTRATLPDVITTTLLPYCDGDVSDQQGQHFYADSRNAFSDDDVLRSDIWVMGTDHDFYNTSWTPPYPGASDDWSQSSDAVCGTNATALASGSNIRLTATQQYAVGTAYLAGFFELTLGGQTQYQGMFDGSGQLPPSVASFADVRTVAQQPASDREDITDFASVDPLISTSSTATATVCANRYGRTVPEAVPSCTTSTVGLTSQQQPYWTPASYAPNVPLNQLTHLTWTAATGSLGVTVPKSQQNVSKYEELTVSASPDENVTTGTDLTLTVTDSAGHSWSSLMSALNPATVNRMPGTTSTNLRKLVLQQVHVPVATLQAAGLDATHIARISFTAAVGADGIASGGVYLQDLSFDTPSLGTPSVHTRPTVNVDSTEVEEGSGPDTAEVAVYLSQASTKPASAWLTLVGSATGKAGLALQKVTFAPGQTCQAVEVPISGDTAKSASPTTAYKVAVSDTTDSVLGSNDFGTLTVREDDGIQASGSNPPAPAPAAGVQGDACAELAAKLAGPGTLTVDDTKPAPGQTITASGSGFRSGEEVDLSLGGTKIDSALAASDGTVSFSIPLDADQALGDVDLTATGAGSERVLSSTLDVLATTTTALALDPAVPTIGQPVTLTATVTGEGADGVVTFTDGSTVLGSAAVADGVATLTVSDGFGVGDHSLVAAYAGTDTTSVSSSDAVSFSIALTVTHTALTIDPAVPTIGQPVTLTAAVSGAGTDGGEVTFTDGSTVLGSAAVADGEATLTVPGGFGVGDHSLVAAYAGTDTTAVSSSDPVSFSIALTVTHTALTVDPAAPGIHQPVTLTAAVSGAGTDGGQVTFTDGSTVLGSAAVSSGVATLTVPGGFGAGDHSLAAAYAGTDTTAVSSSDPVSFTILKITPTVVVSLGKSTYGYGAKVAGTVTVSGAQAGEKVQLKLDGVTRTLVLGAAGSAAFTLPAPVAAGKHSLSASYAGSDTQTAAASAKAAFTVAKAKTSVSFSLSKSTLKHGATETLKVTVKGIKGASSPTGKIAVSIAVGSSKKTKTVTLSTARKGVISISLPTPGKKGTATVHVSYKGNGNYLASTAAVKKVKLK